MITHIFIYIIFFNSNKTMNTRRLIRESRRFRRMLGEAYGDDMPQMRGGQGQMPNDGAMPNQGGQMQQSMNDEYMETNEGEANAPYEEETEHNNVIDQIRQLAIKGIAQYADDIESEQYQSLKKIWLLTDKFYEGLENEEGNNVKK